MLYTTKNTQTCVFMPAGEVAADGDLGGLNRLHLRDHKVPGPPEARGHAERSAGDQPAAGPGAP